MKRKAFIDEMWWGAEGGEWWYEVLPNLRGRAQGCQSVESGASERTSPLVAQMINPVARETARMRAPCFFYIAEPYFMTVKTS